MKRRGFLQGLALLVPGLAAAPALAKTVMEPVEVARVHDTAYFELTEFHTPPQYAEVLFSELQEETYKHPEFGKFDSDGRPTMFITSIVGVLMESKKKEAARQGKHLRLVFHTNDIRERIAPPLHMDRYYLPGGIAIRWLASEVVIRNNDGSEAVIKSRYRPLTEVAGLGTA